MDHNKDFKAMPQSHQQVIVDHNKDFKAMPQSHQQVIVDQNKDFKAMPQSHQQVIVDKRHPHRPAMAQLSALERESRSSYDVLLQCNMLQDVLQSQQQCVPMYQDVALSEQNEMFQTDDTEASQKQRIVTDSLHQLAASNVPHSTNVSGFNSQVMTTSLISIIIIIISCLYCSQVRALNHTTGCRTGQQ